MFRISGDWCDSTVYDEDPYRVGGISTMQPIISRSMMTESFATTFYDNNARGRKRGGVVGRGMEQVCELVKICFFSKDLQHWSLSLSFCGF